MQDLLRSLVDRASELGAEYAEARLHSAKSTHIIVEDGKADKTVSGDSRGVCIRVLCDGAWGVAPSGSVEPVQLEATLSDAISMARRAARKARDKARVVEREGVSDRRSCEVKVDPRSVPLADKVQAMAEVERQARDYSSQIVNTTFGYSDAVVNQLVVNSFGGCVEEEVIRCRVGGTVVAADEQTQQLGYEGVGGVEGYEVVERWQEGDLGVRAAKKAVHLLKAKPPPAGQFTVIFDPVMTGVFTHEILGHNAEGDLVASGNSIILDKVGEEIGSPLVTIVDDPTLPGLHGSHVYDDEGTPCERVEIVKEGHLRTFLHNLETASELGATPTGSARAQNHLCPPIVRMSNTFIVPGNLTPDEIIAGTEHGVYLAFSFGGYVDTARGQFTLRAERAWMVENGKLTQPLRDVSVSGLLLETLKAVEAVGNDLEFWPGTCGKMGQGAPTACGGPTIRIKSLTVGGHK